MKIESYEINDNLLRKNYYRTALPRSLGPSAPLKRFEKFRRVNDIHIRSVLDYGAGKCRDKKFCLQKYDKYIPHDIHKPFRICQPNVILEKKDALISLNYIRHIIIPEHRKKLVRTIKHYLHKGSIILLAVRTRSEKRDIKRGWIKYKDGWVTTRLTFQHFFEDSEIYRLFRKSTQKIENLGRGTYILF